MLRKKPAAGLEAAAEVADPAPAADAKMERAALAAAVFFVAGLGCVITAGKIFFAQRQLRKIDYDNSGEYRQNVKIHIEDDFDA